MIGIATAALYLFVASSDGGQHTHGNARPGVHGMVLFGKGQHVYLSHIPMFHRPHDLQLLLRARVTHGSWKQVPDFSRELFTFVPERMDLTEVANGQRKEFRG